MTVRLYAEHKKFPLEAVTTAVRHGKIHASDCRTCETQEGKVDRFERTLELAGDLTGEQRERMLAIAEKCPVHRSLRSEVSIETRLGEAEKI
jgi:putative redox protein